MTELEGLLEKYPGTHVAWFGDRPTWSLSHVDFAKSTAYVVNGHWLLEWSDTDLFVRDGNSLEWLGNKPENFRIEKVEDGRT